MMIVTVNSFQMVSKSPLLELQTVNAIHKFPYLENRRIYSREIVDSDLERVSKILTHAFGYSADYFSQIVSVLSRHATPVGFPKYGYVLLSDDAIVGVILLIFSTIGSGGEKRIRCHVTSWSVHPSFRTYAALFFNKALKHKNVTYLNLLAIKETLPLINLQGFSKCTGGQLATIPLLSRGSPHARVRLVLPDAVSIANVDASEQELLLDHQTYGCISLWCLTPNSAHPFVFRPRRFKRFILGAQLIYCHNVSDFVKFVRPIGVFLALRGIYMVAINANEPIPGLTGKYFPGICPLYFKGTKPRAGDLAYTQFAMSYEPQRVKGHKRGLRSATLG
jgi:hypothetical protein